MDLADFEAWFGRVEMVRQWALSHENMGGEKRALSAFGEMKRG